MNQHLPPPASPHAPRLADLLIRAAAIYSMAQDRVVYQAIAIRDEWIVAVSLDPHGLDGGAEGGALDEPYVNNPGYRGHLLWNPDDLLTLTNFAVRRGWKIGTHAIGDCAVRTLLDVYEQVSRRILAWVPAPWCLSMGSWLTPSNVHAPYGLGSR